MDNEEQLKFEHLLAAASSIKESNECSLILQSYLYSQCSMLSSVIKLPKNIFGSTIRCSHCFTSWENNKFSDNKHVSKKKLTSSAKKKYKSIILNKNGKRTISEINNASMILNSKILVIKCKICKKSTEVYCKKQNVQNPQKTLIQTINNQNIPDTKNKLNNSNTQNSTNQKSPSNKQHTPNKNLNQNVTNNKKYIKDNKNAHLFYRTVDEVAENKSPQPTIDQNAANKKKKKKDKFAGLFKDVCIASQQNTVKKDNPLNILLRQT